MTKDNALLNLFDKAENRHPGDASRVRGLEVIIKRTHQELTPLFADINKRFGNDDRPYFFVEDLIPYFTTGEENEEELKEVENTLEALFNVGLCYQELGVARKDGQEAGITHPISVTYTAFIHGSSARTQQVSARHDLKEEAATKVHQLVSLMSYGHISDSCSVPKDDITIINALTNTYGFFTKRIRKEITHKKLKDGRFVYKDNITFKDLYTILDKFNTEIDKSPGTDNIKKSLHKTVKEIRREIFKREMGGQSAIAAFKDFRRTPNNYQLYINNIDEQLKSSEFTSEQKQIILETKIKDREHNLIDYTTSLKHNIRSAIKSLDIAEIAFANDQYLTPAAKHSLYTQLEILNRYLHTPNFYIFRKQKDGMSIEELNKEDTYKERLIINKKLITGYMDKVDEYKRSDECREFIQALRLPKAAYEKKKQEKKSA